MGQAKRHSYRSCAETGGETEYEEAEADTNKSSEEEEAGKGTMWATLTRYFCWLCHSSHCEESGSHDTMSELFSDEDSQRTLLNAFSEATRKTIWPASDSFLNFQNEIFCTRNLISLQKKQLSLMFR